MSTYRNKIRQAISLLGIVGGILFFLTLQTAATLKYKKETDKNCTFCHTGIPRKGDEDPQLTEDGKKFKENGYKLSEEQKRKSSVGPVPDHLPQSRLR